MRTLKNLFVPTVLLSAVLLGGCATVDDRLVPSGETVVVPQGSQFCRDNPGDTLCSK